MGDDLQPPALLDEQTFQKSRRPGGGATRDRQPEMGDAGLEVVHEAGSRVGQLGAVVGDEAIRELAGDLAARRLVGRGGAGLELGPEVCRTLAARLRIRCTRQRWRAERGKQVSIVLMTPAAPSLTTRSGSPRPRRRMSWKNADTVSVSSFERAIR